MKGKEPMNYLVAGGVLGIWASMLMAGPPSGRIALLEARRNQASAEVRRDAVLQLSDLLSAGERSALDPIIEALDDKDREVREAAADSILSNTLTPDEVRRWGGDADCVKTAATSMIAAAKKYEDPGVLKAASELIGIRRYSSEMPFLLELADYEDTGEREKAISALSRFKGKKVVAALRAALRDEESSVAWEAARGLVRRVNDDALKKEMRPKLQSKDWLSRRAALLVLQKLKDKESVPEMIGLLNDSNRQVVKAAIGALGSIGDERAAGSLLKLLEDPREVIAADVVIALRAFPGERTTDALLNALADDREEVASRACLILVEVGGKTAVPGLIHTLETDCRSRVAIMAVVALGMLKDSRAVEPLIEKSSNPNQVLSCRAMTALGYIGDKRATQHLLRALRSQKGNRRTSRFEWVRTKEGWRRHTQTILQGTKEAAIHALGEVGDVRALGPLLSELEKSEYPNIRVLSANALAKLRDKRARSALLKVSTTDPVESVRQAAKTAILEIDVFDP